MKDWTGRPVPTRSQPADLVFPAIAERDLRDLVWKHAGLVRDGKGLCQMLEQLAATRQETIAAPEREHFELRSIFTVAGLIARCAYAREESRGGHYRTDFPEKRDEFQRHSIIRHGSQVTFE